MNPGIGAGLIRMHFHDCFLRGCDASLWLDSVPGKPVSEKDNVTNNPSLCGFEVIDEAKAQLEHICPGIVSCADILTFAARDSALKLGGIYYDVPAGHRDGRVSLSSEVLQNLPPPSFNAKQLRDNFKRKGLNLDEMVTLSGPHSIGVSHCTSFSNQLYAFNATHICTRPFIGSWICCFLEDKVPPPSNGGFDPTVFLDVSTSNRLDSKYYANLQTHRGLLTSDQTLFGSPLTTKIVKSNAKYGSLWAKKLAAAMVHMGSIDVLTGKKGEIRRNCRSVN